jgi:hypothetical protein
MEALLNTSTMEQATEYLLTHPPPIIGGVVRVSWHRNILTFYCITLAAEPFLPTSFAYALCTNSESFRSC